jgi:AcrR family transcriptional regulator
MSTSVKRNYSSALRTTQAIRTRRAVVDAAARLFVERGFGRTTVDAVAQAAGVSRKTVFGAAGGKVELLKLALDWAVVGDDAPVALADRPEVERLKRETDPDAMVGGWVTMVTMIASRIAGLSEALVVAAGIDPRAHSLWQTTQAQRLSGARAFVSHLADRHGLRADLTLDEAADIAWVHSDPGLYHRLVVQRGWTERRFQEWLLDSITRQLRA